MNKVATLLAALLATALFAGPSHAFSASEISEPIDTTELETIFWECDYAAAMHGVDGSAGMLCASATDELKMKRFGGSFEHMLEWWSSNRAEQYAALDRVANEVLRGEEFEMGFPESI